MSKANQGTLRLSHNDKRIVEHVFQFDIRL